MRLAVVVGTRPEIVKMASIVHELRARHADFTLIHTGQHYDRELSQQFFEELDLPKPDMNLEIGSGTPTQQTATAMQRLERALLEDRPDLVLVEGDTNTVLAAALAAAKIGVRVAHVEAGLRSYDRRMPEEHNRRVTDHISDVLFAPTEHAASILREESCPGAVHVTGNTVIDACLRYGPRAKALDRALPPAFALATAHRAENVDDASVLGQFVEVFTRCPVPIVYPVHPRTRDRLRTSGLLGVLEASGNVVLLPPVGYLEFLGLLMRCSFVLTDSGGIQEEATAPNVRKKVFVLRESTERPDAVRAGFAEVLGTRAGPVLERIGSFLDEAWVPAKDSPYGRGTAGRRIVSVVLGRS
jgi:UDP-N-acetylglucosamine 2-epimerase (non-hydrolysing)